MTKLYTHNIKVAFCDMQLDPRVGQSSRIIQTYKIVSMMNMKMRMSW